MPKICLDAGHYGKYNRSPANKAYYESVMAWKLHELLAAELKSRGFEVKKTRKSQASDLNEYYRGTAADGCALIISIHSNATGGAAVNENTDYPVAIVQLDGKGDKLGEQLAECIEKTMGTKQDGRIYKRKGSRGEYYGVLRGAAAVGVMGIILEHSFHSNTAATNWLLNEDNLAKMAKAEADVIAAYFGTKKDEKEADIVNIEMNILKRGAKGEQVKTLQRLLLALGYNLESYGADGSFGGCTERAVKAFQSDKGLKADGIVGAKTWDKLLKG